MCVFVSVTFLSLHASVHVALVAVFVLGDTESQLLFKEE